MGGNEWTNVYGVLLEWYWQRKTKVLKENHVPVPFVPPQIMLQQIYKIMLCHSVRTIIGANFHWQRMYNYNSTLSHQKSDTLACFLSHQKWNYLSGTLHTFCCIELWKWNSCMEGVKEACKRKFNWKLVLFKF